MISNINDNVKMIESSNKDAIKECAYFYWLKAGMPLNKDLDFWLMAEQTQPATRRVFYIDVANDCDVSKIKDFLKFRDLEYSNSEYATMDLTPRYKVKE